MPGRRQGTYKGGKKKKIRRHSNLSIGERINKTLLNDGGDTREGVSEICEERDRVGR